MCEFCAKQCVVPPDNFFKISRSKLKQPLLIIPFSRQQPLVKSRKKNNTALDFRRSSRGAGFTSQNLFFYLFFSFLPGLPFGLWPPSRAGSVPFPRTSTRWQYFRAVPFQAARRSITGRAVLWEWGAQLWQQQYHSLPSTHQPPQPFPERVCFLLLTSSSTSAPVLRQF